MVGNLADFLVVALDPMAYGPKGGLDHEYVARRMGRSARQVERYREMVRDNHPQVVQARLLIGR